MAILPGVDIGIRYALWTLYWNSTLPLALFLQQKRAFYCAVLSRDAGVGAGDLRIKREGRLEYEDFMPHSDFLHSVVNGVQILEAGLLWS